MKSLLRNRLKHLWQLLILAFCFGGLVLMLEYGSQITIQNNQIISQQTHTLTRLVIRQAAKSAAPSIAQSNQQALEALILQLSEEPLILDATLYDLEGVTIARSPNAMPLSQTLGLNTPLAMASLGRQQVVEPILYQKQVVGFLRLTIEQANINAVANNQADKMINTVRGLVLGAMFMGLLLALTFGQRRDIRRFQYLLTSNKK
ncbi:YtjB family periplasmic protein [Thaumasiovibrio sp. DFM-14]|uniref:YtjB family periplasmic protein n=1 Tax=Thaumasiovibrio sp. DFM-14 TaxID=3384792 RepID=UPI0039A2EC4E